MRNTPLRNLTRSLIAGGCIAFSACVAPSTDDCIWADGFETSGPDSVGDIPVEVSESSATSLTLLAGTDRRTIYVPAREGVLMPARGELLTLSNFYSGTSRELGPVLGEARFTPSVRLARGEVIVLQISDVRSIDGFAAFEELDTCNQGAVTRLAAIFSSDSGDVRLSPGEGAFATIRGSRRWIELLDGFRASGDSGMAYVVAASD